MNIITGQILFLPSGGIEIAKVQKIYKNASEDTLLSVIDSKVDYVCFTEKEPKTVTVSDAAMIPFIEGLGNFTIKKQYGI